MNRLKQITIFTVAALCLGLAQLPAIAAGPDTVRPLLIVKGPANQRGGKIISAKQAANRARGKFGGGRVLSVKFRDNAGDPFYAVKLIKDGKVQIIYIPARD